jgi:subtilase family serine protease
VEIPLKNASSVNAGPFRVSYQINNGAVVELVFGNGLAAGASTIVWISPSLLPAGGTYNFVADIYDTVKESNEGNNGWNGIY